MPVQYATTVDDARISSRRPDAMRFDELRRLLVGEIALQGGLKVPFSNAH